MQGLELRAIRKGLGLSQGEFGAAIGMTQTFIGMMERDERPIERRTALAAQHLMCQQMALVPRLQMRASDIEWIPGERQIHATLADFRVDLTPGSKGRWSISLRHRSGYSPPWPRWEDSLENAKASAILHVQLGLLDIAEHQRQDIGPPLDRSALSETSAGELEP